MAKKKASEGVTGAVLCRVLTAISIAGVGYKADDVVSLPAELADSHAELGVVDADPGAVSYCVDELKAAPRDHAAEVAALEAAAKAAAEAAEAPQA